jgi:hypothetical protein
MVVLQQVGDEGPVRAGAASVAEARDKGLQAAGAGIGADG